ncbi:hypothetical protein FXO38_22801 [Capsicum annuum]|nr:hypothetical protein FXO38_22801 [Capsicum annuum]
MREASEREEADGDSEGDAPFSLRGLGDRVGQEFYYLSTPLYPLKGSYLVEEEVKEARPCRVGTEGEASSENHSLVKYPFHSMSDSPFFRRLLLSRILQATRPVDKSAVMHRVVIKSDLASFLSAVFNPMRSQSMHDEELPTGNQLTLDSGEAKSAFTLSWK